MIKNYFLLLLTALIIASCGNPGTKTDDSLDVPDGNGDTKQAEIDNGDVDGIVQSFGNPVEMAALVQEVGTPFSLSYLCPTDKIDDFNTDFKKALGLGMLSADLGYLNIYEKTTSIVNYITVIKRLADDLRVGQFFDFPTLKRLATNNENLDSLMFLSVNSFNQMDTHLREHNRQTLSSLIVTGVWLEGLYLGTQVLKVTPNKQLAERIGEQKIILTDLLAMLRHFKDDKNFQELVKNLDDLDKAYQEVKITYQNKGETTREENGRVVIEENSTSEVHMTDAQLQTIIKKTQEIRNNIIKL